MIFSRYIVFTLLILGIQALFLYLMGQPAICTCGYIKVWEGAVLSSGNSQHIFDWYSFSHIIHGFLFYFLLWRFFPKMSFTTRFFISLGLEAGWEIIENTPFVINLYRQQALAQGYTGDSIINSLIDTLSMIFGFFIAWKKPVWMTVMSTLALELWVGCMIHDNFTLNVINLIHRFDFIQKWQMG